MRQRSISPKANRRQSKSNIVPRREVGLNFLVQHQTVRYLGNIYHWPRLHLHERVCGETKLTTLEILNEYFYEHPRYSDAWRLNTSRATGLFADYCRAKIEIMSFEELSAEDTVLERNLLRGFAIALKNGTIGGGQQHVKDPLGLGWRPRGDRQARVYLSSLTNFLFWMAGRSDSVRWQWLSQSTSPRSPASAFRVGAELAIRQRKSFLRHLDGQERAPPWHDFAEGVIAPEKASTTALYSFPAAWAATFIFDCFDLEDEAQMTAATVVAILFCGGLRMSEPLHCFTTDVQMIDNVAHLFFQHPAWGIVKGRDGRKATRAQFLQEFGLKPRNQLSGRLKAGWKGMANDDRITQAYWLPIPVLRRRVHDLLYRYLAVTRPSIMSRRPAHVFNHPFLFVSARAHDGGDVGDPYTVGAFRHAWDAAIKRLSRRMGDAEIRPLKSLGTTPHGSRHFAGHFLKLLRVPPEIITRVMNHRDPTSQEIYGRLSAFEVNELLQSMAAGSDPETASRSSYVENYNYFNQISEKWESAQ